MTREHEKIIEKLGKGIVHALEEANELNKQALGHIEKRDAEAHKMVAAASKENARRHADWSESERFHRERAESYDRHAALATRPWTAKVDPRTGEAEMHLGGAPIMEEGFEAIGDEALEKVKALDVDKETLANGLWVILSKFRDALSGAEEETRA